MASYLSMKISAHSGWLCCRNSLDAYGRMYHRHLEVSPMYGDASTLLHAHQFRTVYIVCFFPEINEYVFGLWVSQSKQFHAVYK